MKCVRRPRNNLMMLTSSPSSTTRRWTAAALSSSSLFRHDPTISIFGGDEPLISRGEGGWGELNGILGWSRALRGESSHMFLYHRERGREINSYTDTRTYISAMRRQQHPWMCCAGKAHEGEGEENRWVFSLLSGAHLGMIFTRCDMLSTCTFNSNQSKQLNQLIITSRLTIVFGVNLT